MFFLPWHPKMPVTPLFPRFVTGTFMFARALFRQLSRAVFKPKSKRIFEFLRFVTGTFFHGHLFKNCHGQFTDVTGTFSKNVTGKSKSVTGKKITLRVLRNIFELLWLNKIFTNDQFKKGTQILAPATGLLRERDLCMEVFWTCFYYRRPASL